MAGRWGGAGPPASPLRPMSSGSAPPASPLRTMSSGSEYDRYLADLLNERHKLSPFQGVLPHCTRLLSQEILRVTRFVSDVGQEVSSLDRAPSGVPMSPSPSNSDVMSSGAGTNEFWPRMSNDVMMGSGPVSMGIQNPAMWPPPGAGGSPVLKKTLRIDIPVDKHPDFNFVGRILGPRGLSLKRVEATTGCRVLIRGRGSIRDPAKEEKMKDRKGYEHLQEPLHLLVEAELPSNTIDTQLSKATEILEELLKPVDESHDTLKKNQLRELAMLNGTLREGSPGPMQGVREGSPAPGGYGSGLPPYGSMSYGASMKRAKTRR